MTTEERKKRTKETILYVCKQSHEPKLEDAIPTMLKEMFKFYNFQIDNVKDVTFEVIDNLDAKGDIVNYFSLTCHYKEPV